MNRRSLTKQTGTAAGATAAHSLVGATTQGVSLIVDPRDAIASEPPSAWAVGELRAALSAQGVTSQVYPRMDAAPAGDRYVVVAGANNAAARQILKDAKTSIPSSAEALCLVPGNLSGRPALLAGGSDTRGLLYAVLELADRVKCSNAASAALEVRTPVVEKPANVIRSCARCFVTPVEDKAWFYDRDHWVEYLSMLAAQRFNRFNLTFGVRGHIESPVESGLGSSRFLTLGIFRVM